MFMMRIQSKESRRALQENEIVHMTADGVENFAFGKKDN